MSRLKLVTLTENILHNAREIRKRMAPSARMIAVVKANAYGHGSVWVASALQENALADAFAVATPSEGKVLREAGISLPILVLGYADKEDMVISCKYDLSQTVYTIEMLDALSDCARYLQKNASAQLKIDTGMNRIGVKDQNSLRNLLAHWKQVDNVFMAGMFSHFSSADSDQEYTQFQLNAFLDAEKTVHEYEFFPMRHIAASSALTKEAYGFDAVRAGIVLYGACAGELEGCVKPAQKLSARPIRIETIKAGESIGYSRAFRAERDMRVMTIPCGYGDGYPRQLSGKAHVLVNGQRAKIVGNVCMDMMMCDITDIENVTNESEVVLLGSQQNSKISPEELAHLQGTIPYEIMLGFSERVERDRA